MQPDVHLSTRDLLLGLPTMPTITVLSFGVWKTYFIRQAANVAIPSPSTSSTMRSYNTINCKNILSARAGGALAGLGPAGPGRPGRPRPSPGPARPAPGLAMLAPAWPVILQLFPRSIRASAGYIIWTITLSFRISALKASSLDALHN